MGVSRLADVSSVILGILVGALVGIAALLIIYRRHEKRAERELTEQSSNLPACRSLAEADLALLRADLAAQSVGIGTLAELDDPGAEEMQEELQLLREQVDALSREAASSPGHVEALTSGLAEVRRGLARLSARIAGESDAGTDRAPCFFNPNHGPSSTVVGWTTADDLPVRVPCCHADAERLRSGASPYSRTVSLDGVRVAWWEAGAIVRPWARGWFGELAASFPTLAEADDDTASGGRRLPTLLRRQVS